MGRYKFARWMLLAALGLAALAVYWRDVRKVERKTSKATLTAAQEHHGSSSVAKRTGISGLDRRLQLAVDKLRGCRSPAESKGVLAQVTEWLSSLTPAESLTVVREFLRSGADAPSGLAFQVGPDGLLTAAPTLRVHLLDLLARVAPKQSAVLAREILDVSGSPDEWAVCLRNFALNDGSPERQAFLQGKLSELMSKESWKQNPSTGFLEAFDVAVYLGGTNLVPALSELVRDRTNPALAHAAFLSLDRLVLQEPSRLLNSLLESPALLAGRESTRAGYFARADLADSEQLRLVERYVLDPRLAPAELEAFAGIFPNASYMVSYNLLTRQITPDRATLARRDRQALAVVESWLADPRFQSVRASVLKIQQRLQQFVAEAEANR